MTKYLLPLCAALLLLPATAAAAPAETNDEGARVVESSQAGIDREVIFDVGDTLDGEVLTATGADVSGTRGIEHSNMIHIRGVFTPELIRLANDI